MPVVVIMPTVVIAFVVVVPAVVVLESSPIAVPVAGKEPFAVVVRDHPMRARIGRQRPVSGMPAITSANHVPVAIDPDVLWTGPGR